MSQIDPDRLAKIVVDNGGVPILGTVRNAVKKEKIIPKEHEQLIPPGNISILSLLDTPLPEISSTATPLPPARSCVAHEPPNWTEGQLKIMGVPPREWLVVLDLAIGEEWLAGIQSVAHPTNPNVRFPLWVGTYWTVLSEAIQERRIW